MEKKVATKYILISLIVLIGSILIILLLLNNKEQPETGRIEGFNNTTISTNSDKSNENYIEMTEENHRKYNTGDYQFVMEKIIDNNDKTFTIKGRVYREIELPTVTKEQYQDLINKKTVDILGFSMQINEENGENGENGGYDLLIQSTTGEGPNLYVDKNSDGTAKLMYYTEEGLFEGTDIYMQITVDESVLRSAYENLQDVKEFLEQRVLEDLEFLPFWNNKYIFKNGKCIEVDVSPV